MTASEIASGKPQGQTYADERISLLVESGNSTEIVGSIVEKIMAVGSPTLPDLTRIVDQYFARDTTILLLVQSDRLLHIVTRGNGTVFLKREDKVVPLLSKNASASGPLGITDIFILAGHSFLSAVTPSVFTILLEKTKETEVEEKIVAYMEQNTQTDTLCLLLYTAPGTHDDLIIHEIPEKKPRNLLPSFRLDGLFSSFSPSSKQQKLTIIIGGILLLLLVASLVFGSRERERIGTAREFEEIKTEVSEQITEAEQLVDIAPEQAVPILATVREILNVQESKFPSESPHYEEFNSLVAHVNELSDRASRKYAVEPTVFFDITWIKEGAVATRMALSENALFLLDTEQGAVYEVGLEQKKSTILGTSDLFKEGVALSLFQGKPYSFVEGSNPKVVNEKGDDAIAHNDRWGPIVDSKSFGGNIYLLDRNNQIWKHPGSESGFGLGSAWLAEDAVVDFSNAQSFAIDGNIWVLTPTGIHKLAMGGQDPFFLKTDSISTGRKLWTSEDSKYLYVLEDSRIVVFDKEGSYREQYVWDGFTDATDFAVAEQINKILILQKDKVYAIDRK